MQALQLYVAGRPSGAGREIRVASKTRAAQGWTVCAADAGVLEAAIAAAHAAREPCRRLPAFVRRQALTELMRQVHARSEELSRCLVIEVGKTIHEARGEVARMLDTLRLSAEEAGRIGGEWLPLDASERTPHAQALWRRFPIGPCSFFTPFNFPLNLAAHKIGPAIAAGNPFILKPSPRTPRSSLLLGEMLAQLGLPEGMFSVLPCLNENAEPLVVDPRLKLLSFTGSGRVGWSLRGRAGQKKVVLELGGNAACIVDADADLERAAERITAGAFGLAGQSCISVQRVLAHRTVYGALRERLVQQAASLVAGDPLDEATTLGPMIDEREAQRIESWVARARAAGARVLCGGRRKGAFLDATWLEGVPDDQPLVCDEAFGPVGVLEPFDSLDSAIERANAGEFGLQAGLFVRDLRRAFEAYERLEVGGVILNDVPTFRADAMPYGGVKASGAGREGVRFAIEEMTEIRTLVLAR